MPCRSCACRPPLAAGQLEVLQALEARGLDLGGRAGCAVLAAAVHSGAAPLVAWLLRGGRCDVAAALEQEDLLHEAASRGDLEVLQTLLAAAGDAALTRTDGRGLGRTPLHCAVIHGQATAAELLIRRHQQADRPPASQGQEPAAAAADAGEAAAAAPAGGGLDAADGQGFTALCWAAFKGSTSTLQLLLAAGASTDAATAEGQTPLHLAAKGGHVAAVHFLLEMGAQVAPADVHGCMPLHYCALRGDLAMFVLLFSPSAPALAPLPAAGAALLTAAIRGGSSEMVGIVLVTGATTPAKCREAGQMPVHAAAREGCLDVLHYLFGSGFDMRGGWVTDMQCSGGSCCCYSAHLTLCRAGEGLWVQLVAIGQLFRPALGLTASLGLIAHSFAALHGCLNKCVPSSLRSLFPSQSLTASASPRCTTLPSAVGRQPWPRAGAPITARWRRCCCPAAVLWMPRTLTAAHPCTLLRGRERWACCAPSSSSAHAAQQA